jgi:ATP-dependent Zn protease
MDMNYWPEIYDGLNKILPYISINHIVATLIFTILIPIVKHLIEHWINPIKDTYDLTIESTDTYDTQNKFYTFMMSHIIKFLGHDKPYSLISSFKNKPDFMDYDNRTNTVLQIYGSRPVLIRETSDIPEYYVNTSSKTNNKHNSDVTTYNIYVHVKGFVNYNIVCKHFDMLFKKSKLCNDYDENSAYNYTRTDLYNRVNEWSSIPLTITKTFTNVILRSKLEQSICSAIDYFNTHEEEYKTRGIPHKLGLLFYGAPGTGKSSTIYALSTKYNRKIYFLGLSFLKAMKESQCIFNNIKPHSILAIEDIDMIFDELMARDSSCSNNVDDIVNDDINNKGDDTKTHTKKEHILKLMFDILDGYMYLNDQIIIFTTNYKQKIDKALIRPGRIDHQFKFGLCTREQLERICKLYNKTIDITQYVDKISSSEFITRHCLK